MNHHRTPPKRHGVVARLIEYSCGPVDRETWSTSYRSHTVPCHWRSSKRISTVAQGSSSPDLVHLHGCHAISMSRLSTASSAPIFRKACRSERMISSLLNTSD